MSSPWTEGVKGPAVNDMQMLPSITENPNWVGGQKNTQVSSGDCDTSIDTTLCGRWGKRGKEEEEVEEGGGGKRTMIQHFK